MSDRQSLQLSVYEFYVPNRETDYHFKLLILYTHITHKITLIILT